MFGYAQHYQEQGEDMRLPYMTALLLVGPFALSAGGQGLAAQDTTQAQKRDTTSQQYPQSNNNNMQSQSQYQGQLSDEEVVMRIHHTNQMEIRVAKLAHSHASSAKVKSLASRLIKDHTAADTKVVAIAKQMNITLPTGKDGYGRDGYGRSGMDSTQRNDSTYSSYPRSDTTQGRYGQQSDTSRPYGERADSTQGQYGQGRYGQGQYGQDQDSTMAAMKQLPTLHGAAFDTAFANAMVNGHTKAINMLETAQNQVQNQQLRTFIASTLPTLRTHLQLAQALSTSATTTSSR